MKTILWRILMVVALAGPTAAASPISALGGNPNDVALAGFWSQNNNMNTLAAAFNTYLGTNTLPNLIVYNGGSITNLNATALASGTVPLGRMASTVLTNGRPATTTLNGPLNTTGTIFAYSPSGGGVNIAATNATSAEIDIDSGAGNGAFLAFNVGGNPNWNFQTGAGDSDLYLRDAAANIALRVSQANDALNFVSTNQTVTGISIFTNAAKTNGFTLQAGTTGGGFVMPSPNNTRSWNIMGPTNAGDIELQSVVTPTATNTVLRVDAATGDLFESSNVWANYVKSTNGFLGSATGLTNFPVEPPSSNTMPTLLNGTNYLTIKVPFDANLDNNMVTRRKCETNFNGPPLVICAGGDITSFWDLEGGYYYAITSNTDWGIQYFAPFTWYGDIIASGTFSPAASSAELSYSAPWAWAGGLFGSGPFTNLIYGGSNGSGGSSFAFPTGDTIKFIWDAETSNSTDVRLYISNCTGFAGGAVSLYSTVDVDTTKGSNGVASTTNMLWGTNILVPRGNYCVKITSQNGNYLHPYCGFGIVDSTSRSAILEDLHWGGQSLSQLPACSNSYFNMLVFSGADISIWNENKLASALAFAPVYFGCVSNLPNACELHFNGQSVGGAPTNDGPDMLAASSNTITSYNLCVQYGATMEDHFSSTFWRTNLGRNGYIIEPPPGVDLTLSGRKWYGGQTVAKNGFLRTLQNAGAVRSIAKSIVEPITGGIITMQNFLIEGQPISHGYGAVFSGSTNNFFLGYDTTLKMGYMGGPNGGQILAGFDTTSGLNWSGQATNVIQWFKNGAVYMGPGTTVGNFIAANAPGQTTGNAYAALAAWWSDTPFYLLGGLSVSNGLTVTNGATFRSGVTNTAPTPLTQNPFALNTIWRNTNAGHVSGSVVFSITPSVTVAAQFGAIISNSTGWYTNQESVDPVTGVTGAFLRTIYFDDVEPNGLVFPTNLSAAGPTLSLNTGHINQHQ